MGLHQRSADENNGNSLSLISRAMAKSGAQVSERVPVTINGRWRPSSTDRCPRCGKAIPAEMLLAHAKADEYLIHLIRNDHPEWIRPDGSCPRCTIYYRILTKRTGV